MMPLGSTARTWMSTRPLTLAWSAGASKIATDGPALSAVTGIASRVRDRPQTSVTFQVRAPGPLYEPVFTASEYGADRAAPTYWPFHHSSALATPPRSVTPVSMLVNVPRT